jgi:hypothetical protein
VNVHDIARRLRRVAGTAKRGAERIAHLLGDGIVARRYRGVPHGSNEPFELVYVGREAFARELEVYFKRDDADKIQPIDTMFCGSVAHFAMERRRIAREADRADFVACEDFPGALAFEADALHSPMLDAELRVERSVAEQIRHVRSRAQRRAMREVLASCRYSTWVDASDRAFDVFEKRLHGPYVRRRFGDWAAVGDSETMRRLYARGGRILFVADGKSPRDPVCGALLLDGGGTLAYQLNGFTSTPETIAEHTTALELALFQHAIDYGYARINLGYTRAMLDDGLFTHKRRLGCSFAPVCGSPLFRVRAGSGKRASIYARFPLLVGSPGEWTAMLGFDGLAHPGKRAWHAKLKNYRVPGLARAVVWTPAVPHADEPLFREAITETLDLPDGIEFRREARASGAPRGGTP